MIRIRGRNSPIELGAAACAKSPARIEIKDASGTNIAPFPSPGIRLPRPAGQPADTGRCWSAFPKMLPRLLRVQALLKFADRGVREGQSGIFRAFQTR